MKVVSPKNRPPLLTRKYSWYSFLLLSRMQGHSATGKIPITPSGIEPAILQLVVQCLKQLRHRGVAASCRINLRQLQYCYCTGSAISSNAFFGAQCSACKLLLIIISNIQTFRQFH